MGKDIGCEIKVHSHYHVKIISNFIFFIRSSLSLSLLLLLLLLLGSEIT
jgi:hypothetical protein